MQKCRYSKLKTIEALHLFSSCVTNDLPPPCDVTFFHHVTITDYHLVQNNCKQKHNALVSHNKTSKPTSHLQAIAVLCKQMHTNHFSFYKKNILINDNNALLVL